MDQKDQQNSVIQSSCTDKIGFVLSGGGARGAYEAGVLHYLFVSGPKELRERVKVDKT